MHQRLSLPEFETLLQILDLRDQILAASQAYSAQMIAEAQATEESPAIPVTVSEQAPADTAVRDLLLRAKFLAQHGAYDFALENYGPFLEEHSDWEMALTLTKAAYLADDHSVALHWAARTMDFIPWGSVPGLDDLYYLEISLMSGLQLAKAMALMGNQDAVQTLRQRMTPWIHSDVSGLKDFLMDSARLAVELGWSEEAITLLKQLPHLLGGHSRGHLWMRTFVALLDRDQELFVWALLGMAVDDWTRRGFHYAAAAAAVKREQYQLAIELVAASGFDSQWSGLTWIADHLITSNKTEKWAFIWELLQEWQNSSRFSEFEKMKFLATVIPHGTTEERLKIYTTAQPHYDGLQNCPNESYVREFNEIYLTIVAWAGDEDTTKDLLRTTKPHKDFLKITLKAAVHHDWEFLVDAVWLQMVATRKVMLLERVNIDHLRLELARYQAGRRNTLEEQYAEAKAEALLMEPHELLSQLKAFVSREWKDLDRYRSLLAETTHMRCIVNYDSTPLLKNAASAGNLAQFHQELMQATDDFDVSMDIDRLLAECLQTRTGLGKALEDF